MRADQRGSDWLPLHASAVVLGRGALLILGPSRSGKSDLAWSLLASGCSGGAVSLLGDDRVLLCRQDEAVLARPHPRIAGFIERRDVGFFAVSWCPEAPVLGVVRTGRDPCASSEAGREVPGAWLRHLPEVDVSLVQGRDARRQRLLRWWATSIGRAPLSGRWNHAASPREGHHAPDCGHN